VNVQNSPCNKMENVAALAIRYIGKLQFIVEKVNIFN
jgi:hypothetical protein